MDGQTTAREFVARVQWFVQHRRLIWKRYMLKLMARIHRRVTWLLSDDWPTSLTVMKAFPYRVVWRDYSLLKR